MSVLPTRVQDLLDWMDQRAPVWTGKATQIGLTTAQATVFSELAGDARDAYTARLAADEAARVARSQQTVAVGDARRRAADLIRIIKAFAENSANPAEIYELAQIPAPAQPSPAPPPAKPVEIGVEITPATGALTLRWKASNPRGTGGTSYIVRRRTGTTGDFAFVGVTGTKKFTDSTFVAGPDSVQYTVQGQRADSAGPISDILTINFGRSGPGITYSTGEAEARPVKLAA